MRKTWVLIQVSALSLTGGALIADEGDIVSLLTQQCTSVIKIGRKNEMLGQKILLGLSKDDLKGADYLEVDVQPDEPERVCAMKEQAGERGITYHFWRTNALYMIPDSRDMLIIDDIFSHDALLRELTTFAPRISKYICVKNGMGPWEYADDDFYCFCYRGYPTSIYRGCHGIRLSVIDFLKQHPEWQLIGNQEGFTFLRRVSPKEWILEERDPRVDALLEHKMVLCTGPALGRSDLLKQGVEADAGLIPFKKVFVATNDPEILNLKFTGVESQIISLVKQNACKPAEQVRQLDCTNCVIETLKLAAQDPTLLDDDVILFKHETVMINDMNLIRKAIGKLLQGYDMVARSWTVPNSKTKGTDAFFIKVSAARKLIDRLNPITDFVPNGQFCEAYITSYLFRYVASCYDVVYQHSNAWSGELGFYHIPSMAEAGNIPWDRSNYAQLFR